MINLTAKQSAFVNIFNKNKNLSMAQIYYILKHGSIDGYNNISEREMRTYSQNGIQIRDSLVKKGIDIDFPKRSNTPERIVARKIKAMADEMASGNITSDNKEVVTKFAKKIKGIVDNASPKSQKEFGIFDEELFTNNIMNLYDLVKSGKLKRIDSKEIQVNMLSAVYYYMSSIERQCFHNKAGDLVQKSYVRHPAAVAPVMKLLCEITGTLDAPNTTNIQVNNILQQIEQKRLHELQNGQNIIDEVAI
jgi:hypothetical protein